MQSETSDFEYRGCKLKLFQRLRDLIRADLGEERYKGKEGEILEEKDFTVGHLATLVLGNHEIYKPDNRYGCVREDAQSTLTYCDGEELSLIEMLKKKHLNTPHLRLGVTYNEVVSEQSTVFLSFPYTSNFFHLVNSMEHYCATNPDSDFKDAFFWFDPVVNNQWLANEKSFFWWSTIFRTAIKRIGKTMVRLIQLSRYLHIFSNPFIHVCLCIFVCVRMYITDIYFALG